MLSVKEIFQILIKIEDEENLFEKKICGVYFWKLIRMSLLSEIVKKHKLSENPHDKKYGLKDKMKIVLKNLIINLKNNNGQKDIIIFDNERFFFENNSFKSLYTFTLLNNLNERKINYEIIYPLYLDEKYKTKNSFGNENFKYIFMRLFYFIKSQIKKFDSKDIKYLTYLKSKIEKEMKINDLTVLETKEISKKIYDFIMLYNYYLNYFKMKFPKEIYLICSYGLEPIISAAQTLDINVNEFQHGVFSTYHGGYSFPHVEIPYFPDTLLVFGAYWKEMRFLPKNINIVNYGYPYLRNQLSKYKNINKEIDKVIFISQGTIGKFLSKKAVIFAKENPNKKIIYRLHPGEFLRWKTEYIELYNNRNLKNLEISDNNDKNLYEYLHECEYLIGVYSTVIYEALEIGMKVGIINLYGFEYLEDLIENNYLYKFDKNETIDLNKLENLNIPSKGYLFEKEEN